MKHTDVNIENICEVFRVTSDLRNEVNIPQYKSLQEYCFRSWKFLRGKNDNVGMKLSQKFSLSQISIPLPSQVCVLLLKIDLMCSIYIFVQTLELFIKICYYLQRQRSTSPPPNISRKRRKAAPVSTITQNDSDSDTEFYKVDNYAMKNENSQVTPVISLF